MISILLAAILIQDPFARDLARAEKMGLVVPDLPAAVEALEKSAPEDLVQDSKDRFLVLRSQATMIAALHAHLTKAVGTQVPFPVAGKSEKLKVLGVTKSSVRVEQYGGQSEIAFVDLDPAWRLATVRDAVKASREDAMLLFCLFLAKTQRWDAAFAELGKARHDHPLVVETRKRALDGFAGVSDAMFKARRWEDAIAALLKLADYAPDDSRVAAGKKAVLDAIVNEGKDHARAGRKPEMNKSIDVLKKLFPDSGTLVEAIRDAGRWVAITDPDAYGLKAKPGEPWVLNEKAESVHIATLAKPPAGEFDGYSARFRFDQGANAHGGITWEERRRIAYIDNIGPWAICSWLDEKDPKKLKWVPYYEKEVAQAEAYTISVFIIKGEYVTLVNGEEVGRAKSNLAKFTSFAMQASRGRAYVDQVWLRKKE